MPVTTRFITFLVGDPYKPSFATVTGRGDNPSHMEQIYRSKTNWIFFYQHTVDGRNPAPVDIVNIPLFAGFHTCQVVSRSSEPSTVGIYDNNLKEKVTVSSNHRV